MAVYERTYKGYQGAFTPAWSRFLILPRYAFQRVFASRIFLAFFVGCLTPSLIAMFVIYLTHNIKALEVIGMKPGDLALINTQFFLTLLTVQGMFLGFVLVVIVGPALLSADMSNNALPLYFSRPFSRTEYVLGKMSVLVILLSSITWIPNLLLFFLQAYLAGWEWTRAHLRIPVAIFVGSWVWILTLSLTALAVSAFFKRKMSARIFLFVIFTILGSFGGILTEALGLWWGHNLNVFQMSLVIWGALFDAPITPAPPLWTAWVTLLVALGISLGLLSRKIKAYEVVR